MPTLKDWAKVKKWEKKLWGWEILVLGLNGQRSELTVQAWADPLPLLSRGVKRMLISSQFTYLAELPRAHQSVYAKLPAQQTSGQDGPSPGNPALLHCWRRRNYGPYLLDQTQCEARAGVEESSLPEVSSTESAISCPLRVWLLSGSLLCQRAVKSQIVVPKHKHYTERPATLSVKALAKPTQLWTRAKINT